VKLLIDQNLSFRLCRRLSDLFPASGAVGQIGLAKADDWTIWQYAGLNGFVLVTLDADFAEMATLFGPPPKVIWLRCGNQPTVAVEALMRDHAETIGSFEHNPAACLEIYWPRP
jgi:predicted nuclease of predicted toxin-antitoxin system